MRGYVRECVRGYVTGRVRGYVRWYVRGRVRGYVSGFVDVLERMIEVTWYMREYVTCTEHNGQVLDIHAHQGLSRRCIIKSVD